MKEIDKEIRKIVTEASADFAETAPEPEAQRACIPTCWWGQY